MTTSIITKLAAQALINPNKSCEFGCKSGVWKQSSLRKHLNRHVYFKLCSNEGGNARRYTKLYLNL